MKKSTLMSGIILLNIIAMIVAVSYEEIFNVFCYGLNVIAMLIYYMETR
jgi:predicted membrane protein